MTKLTYTLLESHVQDFFPNKAAAVITRNANMVLRELHRDLQFVERHNFSLGVPKTAGTVAISQDGTTVTGTGTAFASGDVGSLIQLGSDNTWYEVETFTSTTEITINVAWPNDAETIGTYTLVDPFFEFPTAVLRVLEIWFTGYQPLEKIADEQGSLRYWDRYEQAERPRAWVELVGGTDGVVLGQFVPPQDQRYAGTYTYTKRPSYFDSGTGSSVSDLPEIFDDAILYGTYWLCHVQEENGTEALFWEAKYKEAKRMVRASMTADMGDQLKPAQPTRYGHYFHHDHPVS